MCMLQWKQKVFFVAVLAGVLLDFMVQNVWKRLFARFAL